MEDLMRRVRESELTPSQRRILEHMLQNLDEAAFSTARALAERVGVSESTVVRLAQALGFEGFPEFKRALRELFVSSLRTTERIARQGREGRGHPLLEAVEQDLKSLRLLLQNPPVEPFEALVEAVDRSSSVAIVANRSTYALGYYLHFYLGWLGKRSSLPRGRNESYELISSLGEEDLVLGFSFPRYSAETIAVLRFARERGLKVASITDDYLSPAARLSDLVVPVATDFFSFVDSLSAPMSLMNALLAALASRRREEVSRRFEELEEVWKREGIYFEG